MPFYFIKNSLINKAINTVPNLKINICIKGDRLVNINSANKVKTLATINAIKRFLTRPFFILLNDKIKEFDNKETSQKIPNGK